VLLSIPKLEGIAAED
jgi:hypothetical protein